MTAYKSPETKKIYNTILAKCQYHERHLLVSILQEKESDNIKSLRDDFNHHYMITGTTCISFHIFSDLG